MASVQAWGSAVVEHELSCSMAHEIFPDSGIEFVSFALVEVSYPASTVASPPPFSVDKHCTVFRLGYYE